MQTMPIEILLVEDSPGDVRLTQEALKGGRVANKLRVVEDGEEALQFLKKQGKFKNAARPDLVLLDLNLPKIDGREVLREIKSDPELKSIPVVILTTSSAEEDILRTYNDYANCYVTKPIKFEEFIDAIRSIEDFWLSIVKLPKEANR